MLLKPPYDNFLHHIPAFAGGGFFAGFPVCQSGKKPFLHCKNAPYMFLEVYNYTVIQVV